MEITLRKFIREFITNIFSICLNFGMLLVSIHLDMKATPILFAIAIWLGMQDAFWMCAKDEKCSRKEQFEFWFYHRARFIVYSLGFLAFVIEYIISLHEM